MNEVFVDSSYWIALRGQNQTDHQRAVAVARELAAQRRRLVTTHLVFAEIHAAFSRLIGLRTQVIRDFSPGGVTRMETVEPKDFAAAIDLLQEHGDKCYSFCDAVSFVVMRRLGVRQVLSFDHHFRQVGEFEVL